MMSIRYEDRLDGVSNYIPWKVRITVVLKEWKICSFASSKMTKPIDRDEVEEFEALETRAQRVILDGVKDHLITHLKEKKTAKDMWDTLNQLFESKNENRNMALKDEEGSGCGLLLNSCGASRGRVSSCGKDCS